MKKAKAVRRSHRDYSRRTKADEFPQVISEARKLIELETSISGYSWSPDGDKVALLASEAVSEKAEELAKKGFNQKIYEEDWRHVRVWIAEPQNKDDEPRMLELDGSASSLNPGKLATKRLNLDTGQRRQGDHWDISMSMNK